MMAAHRLDLLSEDAFFSWARGRDQKYELVQGRPVAMAGVNLLHDVIVGNVYASLRNQLRGRRCRPLLSDVAVRIPNGNIRYPDVTVDCGRFLAASRVSIEPSVVFEVLSESTAQIDRFQKTEEYKSVPSMRHIVLVAPERRSVFLYTGQADVGWQTSVLEEDGALLDLPAIGCVLSFAELYEQPTEE